MTFKSLILIFCLCSAASAAAATSVLRVWAGGSQPSAEDLKPKGSEAKYTSEAAPIGGLGYEWVFKQYFAFEGEVFYAFPAAIEAKTQTDDGLWTLSGTLESSRAFLNFKVLREANRARVSFGAGLGLSQNTLSTVSASLDGAKVGYRQGQSQQSLAYQALLGIDIAIRSKLLLALSVRYVSLGNGSGSEGGDYGAYEALVGFAYAGK